MRARERIYLQRAYSQVRNPMTAGKVFGIVILTLISIPILLVLCAYILGAFVAK